MTAALAMYKGPPTKDLVHQVSHKAITWWTESPWSHAELLLGDVCYSSSARDGGVRGKVIDLNSGRWDVFPLALNKGELAYAYNWYIEHSEDEYDWAGAARFVLPWLPHHVDQFFCFEAVAAMLQLPEAYNMDGNKLQSIVTSIYGVSK